MTSRDLPLSELADRRPLWVLILAVGLAYANALPASFQFDDFNVIVHAPAVHGLTAWWQAPLGIRPLLKLSYALNWSLSGAPWGFHLANVLIHLASVLLLLRLAQQLLGQGPGALVAALVFALHPVQTEAVSYICGRSVGLSTCFVLLSVLLHERAQGGLRRGMFQVASWLAFVAALLTRETALVLPVGLLLWDGLRGRSPASSLRLAWPHWLLATLALAVPLLHPGYGAFFRHSLDLRSLPLQVAQVPQILGYLGARVALLGPLNVDPQLLPVAGFTGPVLLGFLVLGLWLGGAWWGLWHRQAWAYGGLWALLFLLPTCSLLPRQDLVNERHLYLPMAGLALACGALLQSLLRAKPALTALVLGLVCTVLGTMGILTVLRNRDYRTEISLWEDTVRKSPGRARPHNNLGYAYQEAGRREEARREYLQALALDPHSLRAWANLSVLEAASPQAPEPPRPVPASAPQAGLKGP